jgi:hypothetical protein
MTSPDLGGQIAALLEDLADRTPVERLAALTAARALIDAATTETMADASLAGHSLRDIASAAGVAPNTVRPALARSPRLAPYASPAGVVDAEGLARARYDQQAAADTPRPMRFTRRKSR